MKNTEYTTIDKKFFTDSSLKNIYSFNDLRDQKIAKEMYFSPMMFPYNHFNDWKLGSIFENFFIPSGSYEFDKNNGWCKNHDTKLHIKDYEDLLFNEIRKNVIDQYKKNKQVNLLFSGGIDSLVVASVIISLGLENKTRFITIFDHTQTNADSLINDKKLEARLEAFFEKFPNCQDWIKIDHKLENTVNVYKTESFEDVRVRCTYDTLDRYQNEIFLGGHGGNFTMLHYWSQIDQMLFLKPELEKDLDKILNLDNVYCTTAKKNFVRTNVPMSEKCYIKKRWDLLDGKNQNELPGIVATDVIFEHLRQVDWTTCTDPYEILDACVARRLIERNTDKLLNEFIVNENLHDGDHFVSVPLPYESLKQSIFNIPQNVKHNNKGVWWLEQELRKAKNTGYIDSNTVNSFLAINEISNKINIVCANT